MLADFAFGPLFRTLAERRDSARARQDFSQSIDRRQSIDIKELVRMFLRAEVVCFDTINLNTCIKPLRTCQQKNIFLSRKYNNSDSQ